ncbi:DUF1800 domain-containing protein [Marinobacter hydrocarbonoclasticus]|nr:DUF1800 domain-containing protein [Marinobacter nauticus]
MIGPIVDIGEIPYVPMPDPLSDASVARFLQQASFGIRPGDIERFQELGIEGWLEWQRDLPRSEHLPLLNEWYRSSTDQRQQDRADVWWHHALNGEDQLRQRMAFALSQILVVSRVHGKLNMSAKVLANYYDLLSEHALGNYRNLLELVTLSPAMGSYLSMMGNKQANLSNNRFPDENYAREVMQLFSIGLEQLNPDGTVKRDANGNTIPTYTQADIEALARVFTGWSVAEYWCSKCDDFPSWFGSMQADETLHDNNEKWILGEYFPAGQGIEADMAQAMDMLFEHPNTPAFISHQLIQRLTHSNPSPAYVRRVADAFRDNGDGVRGDLFAVVSAILMDPENQPKRSPEPRKIREPLIAMTSLARALQLRGDERMVDYFESYSSFGQAPLAAPSVFNFFRPDYRQGEVALQGLASPELEILAWSTFVQFNNRLWAVIQSRDSGPAGTLYYSDASLESLLKRPEYYLFWIDRNLMAGRMSSSLKQRLLDHMAAIPASELGRRIEEPLYLAVTSPEFLYQE